MLPKRLAPLTSRRTVRRTILVVGCLAGTLAPAAAQATPDANVSLSLYNVDPVRVGDVRQGQLIVRNFGLDSDTGTVNISDVTLVPSCGGAGTTLGTCQAPDSADQDVIAVGPTATATSGACTPAPGFVVGPATDPDTGRVRFTPFPAGSSVGWSASGQTACTITFNYTVAHMPVRDTDTNRSGKQTNLVGYARLSWTGAPLLRYEGAKVLGVTIDRDQPTLTARALPSPAIATGQPIHATATLEEGTAPAAALKFELFRGDTGCAAGTLVQTFGDVPMNGSGLGQTPTFVANEPGTYWWRATYPGDADNAPVTSPCSSFTKVSGPSTTPPPGPQPPPGSTPGDGTSGGTTGVPGGGTTAGTDGTGGTGKSTTAGAVKRVRLDAFALTRKTFARATASTALAATAAAAPARKKKKAAKKGTTIKYTLSAPATVAILVERVTKGRRAGGKGNKCVKATKKLRKKKSCTRYVTVSTLKRVHKTAGAKKVSFSGRSGRKALPVGSYRMRAGASAGAGTASAERRATFKIVKR
ncbi:MAG TPA: hypothetical protein VGO80_18270 [Solirubrobacteraceae bacterium]|jgi:hypothetical protein|nr:hypothetical protein [Solirubrobacteraceae bacterium]